MNFELWKAETIAALIELKRKYEGNFKVVGDINVLIMKISYAVKDDLAQILLYMHIVARDCGVREIYGLIPTSSEVAEIFCGGE